MNKKLIVKIKTKKFRNLDEKLILAEVKEFLRKNPKLKIDNEKSKDFKKIVKYVKQRMHQSYGMFQKNVGKRDILLAKLRKAKSGSAEFAEIHKKILLTHKSTKERLDIYPVLYNDLFSITGKPKIILDLGCGLNAFSIPYMKLNDFTYIASEFNEQDNEFIEKYFKIIKNKDYKLKTAKINLTKDALKLKTLKADVAFAWKLFDVIGLKAAENIINNLNAKFLIASFSTKTLTGKTMEFPKRIGFERMLQRLNLNYETKSYENEMFYVVRL